MSDHPPIVAVPADEWRALLDVSEAAGGVDAECGVTHAALEDALDRLAHETPAENVRLREAARPFVDAFLDGSYRDQPDGNAASPQGITVGHYRRLSAALDRLEEVRRDA